MTTTTYTVQGMTCGHCVASVTEEITQIAGVTNINVDLGSGAVTVTSDAPINDATIREAIEEAGYELIGTTP